MEQAKGTLVHAAACGLRTIQDQLQAQAHRVILRRCRLSADCEQCLCVPGVRLAHALHAVAALVARGGDRLQPDFQQVLVELRGRLGRAGVIGLVRDHIATGLREARDTRRVRPLQPRHGHLAVGPDGRERLDTRCIARDSPCVASVTDAKPKIHALLATELEARRLDPELMRHRRRGPGRECCDGQTHDEVAHEPHQSPESLLLLTPECGVARYGNTW